MGWGAEREQKKERRQEGCECCLGELGQSEAKFTVWQDGPVGW